MVQVREVTQAGAIRRGSPSSGLHVKASRGMHRGPPVTHVLCSLLPQGRVGKCGLVWQWGDD